MHIQSVQFRSNVGFGIGRAGKGDHAAEVGKVLGNKKVARMVYHEEVGFLIITSVDQRLEPELVPISNIAHMSPCKGQEAEPAPISPPVSGGDYEGRNQEPSGGIYPGYTAPPSDGQRVSAGDHQGEPHAPPSAPPMPMPEQAQAPEPTPKPAKPSKPAKRASASAKADG